MTLYAKVYNEETSLCVFAVLTALFSSFFRRGVQKLRKSSPAYADSSNAAAGAVSLSTHNSLPPSDRGPGPVGAGMHASTGAPSFPLEACAAGTRLRSLQPDDPEYISVEEQVGWCFRDWRSSSPAGQQKIRVGVFEIIEKSFQDQHVQAQFAFTAPSILSKLSTVGQLGV